MNVPGRPSVVRTVTLVALLLAAGCATEPDRGPFVARVGDRLLTHEEVSDATSAVAGVMDSLESSRRYVDQWVTSELLYAEALRRGLRQDPDVRKRIEDSERSVLISALLDQVYRVSDAEPTRAEVESYFGSHRDQLGLLEPFVRVRYLQVSDPDSAVAARDALARVDTADTAGWLEVAYRFAEDPDGAADLASSYAAESRLFAHLPRVREALGGLRAGRISPVLVDDDSYHVVQLVDRVPAGTVPRMEWIEPALRQHLQIETRKQLYARLVQDLRNEAVSRELIEIR